VNAFGPTTDGVVVQSNPHDALKNEVVGSIPVTVGSTQDEVGNILGNTSVPDDSAYRAILNELYGNPLDDQLYALYPTASFSSAKMAFLTFFGDILFNCEAEELARSAADGAPSYLYLLTRGFDQGALAGSGAVHGIDVPYLFETFAVFGYTPDTRALEISAAMQGAWTALAARPNTPPPFLTQSASSWPMFNDSIELVEFGDPIASVTGHRQGRCTGLRNLVTL
jgi:para-nitrobenzyl esterase